MILQNLEFYLKTNISNKFIISVLVLVNIFFKSIYLYDYNIDLDEPFTLFYSQQGIKELSTIFTWENNPPLFFVILHFWIKLFGVDVISARFLPMLFSSMAVVYIYKIGNKFVNQSTAIVSSLLYTCSNLMIMEAHDARVYSLLVLLSTASMYYYFCLINTIPDKKYLIALILTNILLIYAHFLAFFIVLLQIIYSVVIPSFRRKVLKKYMISLFFLLISYLPFIYFFWIRTVQVMDVGINTPKAKIMNLFSSLFIISNYAVLTLTFLIIILLFFIYTYIKKIHLNIYERMIFGWFFLLYLIIFIVSLKIPIITIPKYLIFIVPGFYLSLSIALNYFSYFSKFVGKGMIIVCVFLMFYSMDLKYSQGLEAKRAVSLIKSSKSDSTIVYIVPFYTDVVFTYHYNIEAFKDYKYYKQHLKKDNIYIITSVNDIDLTRLENASDVLLFEGWNQLNFIDPNNYIYNKLLTSKFKNVDILANLKGYTIYHFKSNNL